VRELAEELGIVVDPVDLAFCADAGGDDQGIVISLYTCTRWQGTARNFDAAALRWVVPAAVSELLMPPLDVPLAQALVRLLRAAI
jgi:8-oxo-dGTP diphosphatase